jgi:amino acid transporter
LGYFAFIFLLFPKGNLLIAILVGGLLTGLIGVVYSQLSISLARSGGDYVYQARIFHPAFGAWIGVTFLIYGIYLLATSGVFFAASFVPFIFETIGGAIHASWFTTVAGEVTTQTGTFITAMVLLVVTIAITLAGSKWAARAAFWFVVAGLISVALIELELFLHGGGSFASAFNHASGHPNAYNEVVAQARAHGWKPESTVSETLTEMPYAFLMFGGFWYTAYSGGEVRQPAKTQTLSMALAFAFGLAAVAIAWIAMQHSASGNFVQASGYLQANAPATYEKLTTVASITPQSYAVLVTGSPVIRFIIGLGWAGWLLPGYIMFILALSRTLFALSFDRILPTAVTKVSGKGHNPLVALAITAIITAGLSALVVYDEGITGAFKNVILLGASICFLASIAAIALPYRRKDLYDSAPKIWPGKIAGVSLFVWASIASAAFCGVVVYLCISNPIYSGGFTTTSILSLVIIALSGAIVYGISKLIRGREGIDISLAMRELPPE